MIMKTKVPFLYKLEKIILQPIFKLYYNPKIIDKHNIPKTGSILIVGNHKHLFDQCIPIVSTKRYLRYMAKKEYFDNKKVAWFFKGNGCISVDRQNKDTNATNEAISTLKQGGAIGLFPEGTRNRTNKILLPFKFGAVSMASKTDSYLVPFGITGDYKFRSKNLTIRYGSPFKVENMTLEEANDKLYNEIKNLIELNLKDNN